MGHLAKETENQEKIQKIISWKQKEESVSRGMGRSNVIFYWEVKKDDQKSVHYIW